MQNSAVLFARHRPIRRLWLSAVSAVLVCNPAVSAHAKDWTLSCSLSKHSIEGCAAVKSALDPVNAAAATLVFSLSDSPKVIVRSVVPEIVDKKYPVVVRFSGRHSIDNNYSAFIVLRSFPSCDQINGCFAQEAMDWTELKNKIARASSPGVFTVLYHTPGSVS